MSTEAKVGFRINRTRCIGCNACAVACKAELNTRLGISYRRVIQKQEGTGTSAKVWFTTSACMHCANPACYAACPVRQASTPSGRAIYKDATTGVVLIHQSSCVGCRRCEWACPYGAPQFNSTTKKVEKCTFCEHRLAVGSPYESLTSSITACSQTCPGRALNSYKDMSAYIAESNTADGLPSNTLTNPNVTFITGGTEA